MEIYPHPMKGECGSTFAVAQECGDIPESRRGRRVDDSVVEESVIQVAE